MPAKATTSSTARRSRFSLVLRWQAMAAGQRPRPQEQGTPREAQRKGTRGDPSRHPAPLQGWAQRPPVPPLPHVPQGWCWDLPLPPSAPSLGAPVSPPRAVGWGLVTGQPCQVASRGGHGTCGGSSDGHRVVGTGHGQGGGCSTATVAPSTRCPRGAGSGAHWRYFSSRGCCGAIPGTFTSPWAAAPGQSPRTAPRGPNQPRFGGSPAPRPAPLPSPPVI